MQIKKFILIVITHTLVACTILPGMHMSPFSNESSVLMPIQENNATILKKLNIQTITAQTIIELEKDFNNRSLGPNNVANLYYSHRLGSKTSKGSLISKDFHQYRVGPRDVLTITVWEHPELTIPAGSFRAAELSGNVVGEDGYFYYPYVGAIKAEGRTVEEIRIELSKGLSKYIEDVQMDVRVARYRSQRVYISGEVRNRGVQFVQDIPLTVLEAIATAGGVTPNADQRSVTLARKGKIYTINLLALYENGDLRQNVALKHGDILNVPDRQFNKIFILGDINAGSIFMNKGRMTLNEALSDRSGPNTSASDAARIFIFRSGLGKPKIFHLNTKSPDMLLLAERFPMQPRDIIFVDRVEGLRWNQIINQIQPTLSLMNNSIRRVFPLIR